MYTVSSTANMSDPPFNGLREYWQRSYAGRYITFYEAGEAMAQEDHDNNNSAGWAALFETEISLRGPSWEATRDGYRDKTVRVNDAGYG